MFLIYFLLNDFTNFKLCVILDGRSCYPELSDGGAFQISIQGFQVDYYPFHLAKFNREHWPK